MPRRAKDTKVTVTKNYLDKVEAEVEANQSKISLILGGLIVVVAAFLLFNYFNKGKAEVTQTATQTESTETVSANTTTPAAPTIGEKYTVKAGDTLFSIAATVYKDGYKYTEIVKANKIQNENLIEVGQQLDIPKVTATAEAAASPAPTVAPAPTTLTTTLPTEDLGSKITTATYVVVEGDWLSKISGRAYGDVTMYQKIADANKITNPDLITPGMTLIIPR